MAIGIGMILLIISFFVGIGIGIWRISENEVVLSASLVVLAGVAYMFSTEFKLFLVGLGIPVDFGLVIVAIAGIFFAFVGGLGVPGMFKGLCKALK